jgi:hypothetical protein
MWSRFHRRLSGGNTLCTSVVSSVCSQCAFLCGLCFTLMRVMCTGPVRLKSLAVHHYAFEAFFFR